MKQLTLILGLGLIFLACSSGGGMDGSSPSPTANMTLASRTPEPVEPPYDVNQDSLINDDDVAYVVAEIVEHDATVQSIPPSYPNWPDGALTSWDCPPRTCCPYLDSAITRCDINADGAVTSVDWKIIYYYLHP